MNTGTTARLLPLILAAVCTDTHAAPVIVQSIRSVSYQMLVRNAAGSPQYNLPVNDLSPGTKDDSGGGSANVAPPGLGVAGAMGGSLSSAFVPGDPGVGGILGEFHVQNASAFSQAEQTNPGWNSEVNGDVIIFIDFSLDEPMQWTWSVGNVTGSTSGTGKAEYSFGVYAQRFEFTTQFERSFTGNFDRSDAASGVLPAGTWEVAISLSARTTFAFTTGTSNHSVYLTDARFRLSAVPQDSGLSTVPLGGGLAMLFSALLCLPLVSRTRATANAE